MDIDLNSAGFHLLNTLNETFTAFPKDAIELVVNKFDIVIFT